MSHTMPVLWFCSLPATLATRTRAVSSRSHFVHAKCLHAGRKRVRKQEGGERVQRAPKATARIKVWGHHASLYASRYCFTIASLNRLAANGLSLGSWCPSPRILLPKRTISWLATCRWLLWCQLASPKTLASTRLAPPKTPNRHGRFRRSPPPWLRGMLETSGAPDQLWSRS